MDYEKKYNEALEDMRAIYPNLKGDAKIAVEHSFPELKESEDERIRKEIMHFILYKATGLSEEQEHAWIAYLEKQKEQKKSLSEKFRPDFPKVADFIESVEEQEKDKAIEILEDYLKWAVSESEEECSYTWNELANAIKLGICAMKEQKPNIELIQKSWYMEGYHDREFNKEPKWIIKTGEGGPRYEENPKYGQIIEQKPAEWVLPEDFEEAVYKVANFISPFDNQEELRKASHRFAEQLLSLAKKELDKPTEKQDYSVLNDFERAIHRGFLCAGVENVPVNIIKETAQDCLAHLPVDWSEDFDKEVENVHKRYPEVSFAKLTRIAYHFSKWANRCKGIEWSEEDDKQIRQIERIVESSGCSNKLQEKIHNWFKSLRSSWEPSEDQEEPKYYQHFDPDC